MKLSVIIKCEFDWDKYDLARQGILGLKKFGIIVSDPEIHSDNSVAQQEKES